MKTYGRILKPYSGVVAAPYEATFYSIDFILTLPPNGTAVQRDDFAKGSATYDYAKRQTRLGQEVHQMPCLY